MCRIKDMRRQSKYGWSLLFDGQQYYVELDQCSSKVSVYVYNDVVGGYQYADKNISEQIVSYLDLQEMQEQDWLEEGEEFQEQSNKMTQQQKIEKVKQYAESLGLTYDYDFSQQPMSIGKSIEVPIELSFNAKIDGLKQFYVRKSWYQRHNEEFGFDWFLQEFPFKYPGIETKQQLDAYLEDKVLQIRKKIANGERAENDQQRKARRQKDAKYWKDKQNQYNTITDQKQFVLFEVTKEQAEWFFNQHNRMISEYRLVSDTIILPGINKYKAIKYKTQYEQDEIPCVNMSLCEIYLNVIQD